MGSTGGYWNPETQPVDAVADLIAILADPAIHARLSKVVAKLAVLRERGGERREPKPQRLRKRRPGWVQTAVCTILAQQAEPVQVEDVHAAVEALVGEPVSKSSVNGALARLTDGPSPRLVRVAVGVYGVRTS